MVKDLRNKTESTNPISVLDGNIDQFIEEGIKNKKMKKIFLKLFFIHTFNDISGNCNFVNDWN